MTTCLKKEVSFGLQPADLLITTALFEDLIHFEDLIQRKFSLVSKENPAGRAVAALISYYLPLLPDYAKHKFSRVCSQQETGQHQPYKIDSTLNMLSTGKLAQVSIFTTGLLWANQQAYSPKLIEHLTSSSLVIIEEAQQAADIKTAFATSLLPAESLLVYQGDDRQSPGGSEDMNMRSGLCAKFS